MANSLYNIGRQSILEGSILFMSDTIQAVLCDESYLPSLTSDRFASDTTGGWITSPVEITNKSIIDGFASADPVAWESVTGTVKYILIFKYTGDYTTSPLLCLFDTVTSLPFTASSQYVGIKWGVDSNAIFRI